MTPREKYTPELENLEIDLLLQAIRQLHGVDLREGSNAPIRRRIWEAVKRERTRTVSGLQERLLHDQEAMLRFLKTVIPPVFPFRAEFLAKFRYDIVPVLRTYPSARIWLVGCHSVFETYILPIILLEEGMFEKAVLYCTDVNESFLQQSYDGIFPLSQAGEYENLYHKSGGRNSLEKYFSGGGESGMFDTILRRNMVFSRHNFATDSTFNEFNTILCRCPIKFHERSTQGKAQETIYESLILLGILGLTPGDTLDQGIKAGKYAELDREHNLYRKIS